MVKEWMRMRGVNCDARSTVRTIRHAMPVFAVTARCGVKYERDCAELPHHITRSNEKNPAVCGRGRTLDRSVSS